MTDHFEEMLNQGRNLADASVERRMHIMESQTPATLNVQGVRGPNAVRSPNAVTALGPAGRMAAARGPAKRFVVAEGDSWFDYPRSDVLDVLEDDHDIRVEKVAQAGDTVENMAFNPEQIDSLAKRYERLLRDGKVISAVLLSGGGNDIAGDEFGVMLEHANSGKPEINQVIADELIGKRLADAYARIIGTIMGISNAYLGRQVPIIAHNYGYPVADGRGVLGGAWFLPGPWLSPGFARKAINDPLRRAAVMRQLIDRFNRMLDELAAAPALNGVLRVVDIRTVLRSDPADYKRDWANELHPTQDGFKRVAAAIEQAIP